MGIRIAAEMAAYFQQVSTEVEQNVQEFCEKNFYSFVIKRRIVRLRVCSPAVWQRQSSGKNRIV